MKAPTHTIVSIVRNTTILFYIRIARIRCRGLLRLKQILQSLKKQGCLLQNQSKEAIVVLKNNVLLKFYLPRPQSRSQIHGVLNNLAEFLTVGRITYSHSDRKTFNILYFENQDPSDNASSIVISRLL